MNALMKLHDTLKKLKQRLAYVLQEKERLKCILDMCSDFMNHTGGKVDMKKNELKGQFTFACTVSCLLIMFIVFCL